MPTYRGINIALQSQYDALVIPEFPPPSSTATPSPQECDPESSFNAFKSSFKHVAEVYVPIYPGSQFWICFACEVAAETSFYYFKLLVKDRSLLSWGTGEQDHWSGRVTSGIYDGGHDFEGRQIVEKRGFFFPSRGGLNPLSLEGIEADGAFEIQVFRAKARRRTGITYDTWIDGAEGQGFRMKPSGRMGRREGSKKYTYALIDPKDEPYATFRYNCRTGLQLKQMGMVVPGGNVEDLAAASPSKKSTMQTMPLDVLSSPPPKQRPLPPPRSFTAKDSIALRRTSMPLPLQWTSEMQGEEASPTKKNRSNRNADMFDPFQGLSLVEQPIEGDRRMKDEEKPSQSPQSSRREVDGKASKSASSNGRFWLGSRFKRRGLSRDGEMR